MNLKSGMKVRVNKAKTALLNKFLGEIVIIASIPEKDYITLVGFPKDNAYHIDSFCNIDNSPIKK